MKIILNKKMSREEAEKAYWDVISMYEDRKKEVGTGCLHNIVNLKIDADIVIAYDTASLKGFWEFQYKDGVGYLSFEGYRNSFSAGSVIFDSIISLFEKGGEVLTLNTTTPEIPVRTPWGYEI